MRKLFRHDTLRHRLEDIPSLSELRLNPFREAGVEDNSGPRTALFAAAGALAGFAAGYYVFERLGGIQGVTAKLRSLRGGGRGEDKWNEGEDGYGKALRGGPAHGTYEYEDDYLEDEELPRDYHSMGIASSAPSALGEELEERVLEAFYNDPILCERPVDIGAMEDGVIELTGWVNTADEASHAVTIAQGVPGVETVVNRLTVRVDEAQRNYQSVMYEEGDPSLAEGHWEGQQVGIGRKRQGDSSEFGRHEDPKPELEDKWMDKRHAAWDAAEDVDEIGNGNRKETSPSGRTNQTGGRTDGSPVSPTGVPKADHVAEPQPNPRAD